MAPPSTPDRHPTKEMFDEIVDIIVGEGAIQKMFRVHKGVLRFYSGYFEGALRGGFSEAANGKVELPTEEVEVFERFILWLYTGQVEDDLDDPKQLCELWMLADRREVPLLANSCIDVLRDQLIRICLVPTCYLKFIYDNTTPQAGLRRFWVDVIAKTGASELLDDAASDWHETALRDVLRVAWNRDWWSEDDVAKLDLCQYHTHDAGVKCTKKA